MPDNPKGAARPTTSEPGAKAPGPFDDLDRSIAEFRSRQGDLIARLVIVNCMTACIDNPVAWNILANAEAYLAARVAAEDTHA